VFSVVNKKIVFGNAVVSTASLGVFCTKKMQAGRLRSQLKYFLVIHLNLKSKITKSDFSDFSVVNKTNIPLNKLPYF
jgi:hypothetical protein